MKELEFTIGDKVVTTKGIYGIVVSIDLEHNTSNINVGSKIITLFNNQLLAIKDRNPVVCYYTDGYMNYSKVITLPKQFKLYDFTKPLANELLDYCKKVISKSFKTVFTIIKIEI